MIMSLKANFEIIHVMMRFFNIQFELFSISYLFINLIYTLNGLWNLFSFVGLTQNFIFLDLNLSPKIFFLKSIIIMIIIILLVIEIVLLI